MKCPAVIAGLEVVAGQIPPDARTVKELTAGEVEIAERLVTPDEGAVRSLYGKRLAFVWKPGNESAVYVENVDGSGRHRITPFRLRAGDHPDGRPTARGSSSPRGQRRGNFFTIRSDGNDLRQLTHFKGLTKVGTGSYSPDGESIVFATVVGGSSKPARCDLR